MPSTIEQIHRTYTERGLSVVAVNIQESRETAAAWVRSRKVSVPVVLDASGEVTQRFRVTATPTAFLVTRDGRLVAKALGTTPWTSDRGRALLDALLSR